MKQNKSLDEVLDFMDFCVRQSQEDIGMSRQGTYRFTHPGVSMVAIGAYKGLGISPELEAEAKEIIQEFPQVAEDKSGKFTHYLERALDFEKRIYETLKTYKEE